MEYYVLEALCEMEQYEAAKDRIKVRYEGMMSEDYSTLWEFWDSWRGTKNHAWSGGPLVIMSKHFAGITPTRAGYEMTEINPQYTLSDNMSCTVPSVIFDIGYPALYTFSIFHPHFALYPPSRGREAPVIYADASLAR